MSDRITEKKAEGGVSREVEAERGTQKPPADPPTDWIWLLGLYVLLAIGVGFAAAWPRGKPDARPIDVSTETPESGEVRTYRIWVASTRGGAEIVAKQRFFPSAAESDPNKRCAVFKLKAEPRDILPGAIVTVRARYVRTADGLHYFEDGEVVRQ